MQTDNGKKRFTLSWMIISVSLVIALILVLMADNLLVIPRLFATDVMELGPHRINVPFDWYCIKVGENRYDISSVEHEAIQFSIRFRDDVQDVAVKELIAFLEKQSSICTTYSYENEDVIQTFPKSPNSDMPLSVFILFKRGLIITYAGPIADMYKPLDRIIQQTTPIQAN